LETAHFYVTNSFNHISTFSFLVYIDPKLQLYYIDLFLENTDVVCGSLQQLIYCGNQITLFSIFL
jgi:hypothetical protein